VGVYVKYQEHSAGNKPPIGYKGETSLPTMPQSLLHDSAHNRKRKHHLLRSTRIQSAHVDGTEKGRTPLEQEQTRAESSKLRGEGVMTVSILLAQFRHWKQQNPLLFPHHLLHLPRCSTRQRHHPPRIANHLETLPYRKWLLRIFAGDARRPKIISHTNLFEDRLMKGGFVDPSSRNIVKTLLDCKNTELC
jgi:hypothetical protein